MNDAQDQNLPTWPGAAACYSRAYRILKVMGVTGHVSITRRGKKIIRCTPSEEMQDFICALNTGNEEQIKGLNAQYGRLDPELYPDGSPELNLSGSVRLTKQR